MTTPLPPRALAALRALRVYGDRLPLARRQRLICRVADAIFAQRPEITRTYQLGHIAGYRAGRAHLETRR